MLLSPGNELDFGKPQEKSHLVDGHEESGLNSFAQKTVSLVQKVSTIFFPLGNIDDPLYFLSESFGFSKEMEVEALLTLPAAPRCLQLSPTRTEVTPVSSAPCP